MKSLRQYVKQVFVPALAVGAFLFNVNTAQAQLYAATDDEIAPGSSGNHGVLNTGTGAINYDDGHVIQVNVWDGETSTFSWTISNDLGELESEGSFVLDRCLRDPDVVVQRYTPKDSTTEGIYAMVVYESKYNTIEYQAYRWNQTSSSFDSTPCFVDTLGYNDLDEIPSGAEKIRVGGRNPNIDVNSEGRVAVTWHESFVYEAIINVTYANIVYSDTFDIVRSEVFAAAGYINGDDLFGAYQNSLRGISSNSKRGDRISTTGDFLYEHNIQPDIAISEANDDGNIYLTYTYNKKYFSPYPFAVTNDWVVKQYEWTAGTSTISTVFTNDKVKTSSGFGRPRVASRKVEGQYASDFEVVTGRAYRGCNDDGYFTYSPIWNYGTLNGVEHTVAVNNNGSAVFTDMPSFEPVVTYLGGEAAEKAEYVVAWTTEYSKSIFPHENNANVYAVTMIGGNWAVTNISWVNEGTYSANPGEGVQHIPSVAGRFTSFGSSPNGVYLFADLAGDEPDVKYKGSKTRPGGGNLRTAQPTTGSSFTAYPNPFSNEITFDLSFTKEDRPEVITIHDITGRQLDRINVNELKAGQHNISWKSDSALPAGMYLIRLQGLNKIETIKVVKN